MRAGWLIGCDGAHSLVRRHLGVPFDGEDHAPDWLMAEVNVDWSYRSDFAHVLARPRRCRRSRSHRDAGGCSCPRFRTAPASGGPPTWRRSSAWRRSAGWPV